MTAVRYTPEINDLEDMRTYVDKMFYFDTGYKYEDEAAIHARRVLGQEWTGEVMKYQRLSYFLLLK